MDKFSSFITEDIPEELSVCYSNIYCINGQLTFFSKENIVLPYVNKWTNTYSWIPIIKIVNEIPKFDDIEEINISTFSDVMWISNIGHALFDCLYPIYLALIKFGYEDEKFNMIVTHWDNWKEKATDVMKDFIKGDIIELEKSTKKVYHINKLICGTGRTGNRVIREDYTLYGEKYNGIIKFRNRLLSTYNIEIDKPVNLSPNIIIIDNKRYSEYEKQIITQVIEFFKNKNINIKYVDWRNYPLFKDQMLELSFSDMYVSGPGNGIMYMPLLKKGAVTLNLGWMEHTQTNTMRPNLIIPNATQLDYILPGFMEQSVCAGATHVSTLYYDRYTYNNLEKIPLINLIQKGIDLIQSEEIQKNNHNIDAQIFIEYCKSVNNGREISDFLSDIAFFIELFINEHPFAIPKNKVDIKLLRTLKNKYNYNRTYEIKI